MTFTPRSSEEAARAVTRLVDGALRERERLALEVWAAEHPDATREVAAQRRVAVSLRAGGPSAPASLIAAVGARGTRRRRAPMAGVTRLRTTRGTLGAAAGFAAGLLAAVILVISAGRGTDQRGPTIALAAKLALSPATEPAPKSTSPTLLDVTYGGITLPNYAPRFGAVATGQRADRLGGRAALTVFYRLRDGARLSYTIYSGRPVPLPRTTSDIVFRGVQLHVVSAPSHIAVVTLVRHGHTCVLAARSSAGVLIALAEAPLQA
jgi:hypothetical protein